MASIPLAFSIHNFISSVGADAGFAAIIGLAILVLLYFAHARETANLREEAALLTQRLMQAEARVAQLTRAQAASPAPQAAPPAAQGQQAAALAAQAARPRANPASGALPFAPAGVGAPALAAATRVVPLARVAADPAPAAATAAAAATTRAAAASAPEHEPVQQAPAVLRPPSQPTPFEHDRPAAAPVAAPPAATVAGANGAGNGQGVPPAPGGTAASLPPLRTPPRPGGPAARGPLPPLGEPPQRRSRLGRAVAVVVGAGLVAGVVAVLLIATSGGSTKSSSTPAVRTTNTPTPRRTHTAPAFSPASVTVGVLNGTNVNQLAHRVAAKLTAGGYKQGSLYTAPNQSEQTTVVSYFPGAANRTAALHVATALNLKASAVQPIDQTTQQVACPGSAAATPCANVVVTVGADLSTL